MRTPQFTRLYSRFLRMVVLQERKCHQEAELDHQVSSSKNVDKQYSEAKKTHDVPTTISNDTVELVLI